MPDEPLAPLAPLEKLSTILLLSGYAHNQVALARGIDPARLPALHAVVDEGLFTGPPGVDASDGDAFMLDYGLHRILDGVAALVSARTDSGR